MIGLRSLRIAVLALVVTLGATIAPAVTAAAAGPTDSAAVDAAPGPNGKGAAARAADDSLSATTGLWVTIDAVSPAALTPGRPVVLRGVVTNEAEETWFDNQVYFTITNDPAATKSGLDDFAATGDTAFGDTLFINGLFDEIGAVRPGESKRYTLRIPWAQLPIGTDPAPGVYHVGVSVLAEQEGVLRDVDADARADTLMSLLPTDAAERPARFIAMVPFTARVARYADGTFLDDDLAATVTAGGRLRNLLDLAEEAPPGSLDLVVDPALLDALADMSQGYLVQTLTDRREDVEPVEGVGADAAAAWLSGFTALRTTHNISLIPWGTPDTSAAADTSLAPVVESAVRAGRRYALEHGFNATVVDWQPGAQTTRRGLTLAQRANASVHLVAESTLTELVPEDDNGYPPATATLETRSGPITTLVARSDLAGHPFARSLSSLEFRQYLMAETTVRALSSTETPVTVVAAPLTWEPGTDPVDLAPLTAPVAVTTAGLLTTSEQPGQAYTGPVTMVTDRPGYSAGLTDAIRQLLSSGRTYVDLLTDNREAGRMFDEQTAISGSAAWEAAPLRGEALTLILARDLGGRTDDVTLTVPTFVALSSDSGRFPMTVTNGLEETVTVKLNVIPLNPALDIEPVEPLELEGGERVDIEIQARADGSGVTSVRARLSTTTQRPVGSPHDFDVRATQIGLAIWIVMGVLGALLFSSAALRIVKRVRGGGFHPREEPAP